MDVISSPYYLYKLNFKSRFYKGIINIKQLLLTVRAKAFITYPFTKVMSLLYIITYSRKMITGLSLKGIIIKS